MHVRPAAQAYDYSSIHEEVVIGVQALLHIGRGLRAQGQYNRERLGSVTPESRHEQATLA